MRTAFFLHLLSDSAGAPALLSRPEVVNNIVHLLAVVWRAKALQKGSKGGPQRAKNPAGVYLASLLS